MRSSVARVLALGLGIAGCVPAPTSRYYILSAVPPAQAGGEGGPVVASVHLPGLLDRTQLVVQTGPHRVEMREFDRWAEPLDLMVPRVLNEDLPARFAGPPRSVTVDVDALSADVAGQAILSGTWRQTPADNAPVYALPVRFEFAARIRSTDGDEIASAYSGLLARLAESIAAHGGPKP